jgi:GGDEF domain-containing protein
MLRLMTAPAGEIEDVRESTDQLTDPLTGLGNRRRLLADLDGAEDPNSPSRTLAIFYVGGFTRYVELYGRLEGEALLVRLAELLPATLEHAGSCYRPRDDEFAALIQGPPATAEPLLTAAAASLTARFEHFEVTLSFGAAVMPDEAGEPVEAMTLADTRLFLRAQDRRPRERRNTPRLQTRSS